MKLHSIALTETGNAVIVEYDAADMARFASSETEGWTTGFLWFNTRDLSAGNPQGIDFPGDRQFFTTPAEAAAQAAEYGLDWSD